MKRAILVATVFCAVSAVAASGQGLRGKAAISAFGGYTQGLGDPFSESDFSIDLGMGFPPMRGSTSFDAGVSAGVMLHYGVAERTMIGIEIDIQQYKTGATVDDYCVPGVCVPGASTDDSAIKANILGNVAHALSYSETGDAFFLTAGAGIYGGLGSVPSFEGSLQSLSQEGDLAFGINGGFMYRKMVGTSVGLLLMPRLHMVFSDPVSKLLMISGGISIPFGGRRGE